VARTIRNSIIRNHFSSNSLFILTLLFSQHEYF
jgi:hypothetical protein